ncbi:hypothetical protein VTN96DRAFT_3058 [Rasamsonia emersonii]
MEHAGGEQFQASRPGGPSYCACSPLHIPHRSGALLGTVNRGGTAQGPTVESEVGAYASWPEEIISTAFPPSVPGAKQSPPVPTCTVHILKYRLASSKWWSHIEVLIKWV